MLLRPPRGWAFWILAAAIVGFGVHATHAALEFETDDAYITLRYSEHLAAGQGLRWNSSAPPVEGYSNFLYVVVGAAAIKVGLPPMDVIKVLGVFAIAATSLVLYRLSRLQVGGTAALAAPLLYLSHPFVAWWAASGLETPAYGLEVAGSVFAYLRGLGYRPLSTDHKSVPRLEGRSVAHLRLAGLLVFAASLTRPEGPLIMVAIGMTTAVRLVSQQRCGGGKETWRREVAGFGHVFVAFAYPFCVYMAWRLGHFERLFPNSVYCKAAYRDDPWMLLREFGPAAALALALAVPAWRRLLGTPNLIVFLVALAYAVILYGVAPVVAYGNRHFLAAYALLCVPASVGLCSFARERKLRERNLVVGLAVVIFSAWHGVKIGDRLRDHASRYGDRMHAREQIARWLNSHLEAGDRYVLGDVGLVGYSTMSLDVIDVYCVNNASMTRAPVQGSPEALAKDIMREPPSAIVVASREAYRCAPRSRTYQALIRHPAFAGFHLAAVYGAPGDDFQYFIYAKAKNSGTRKHVDPPSPGVSTRSRGSEAKGRPLAPPNGAISP